MKIPFLLMATLVLAVVLLVYFRTRVTEGFLDFEIVDWYPPLPRWVETPPALLPKDETVIPFGGGEKRQPTTANPWRNPLPGDPADLRFGPGFGGQASDSQRVFKSNTDAQYVGDERGNSHAGELPFYTVPGAGQAWGDEITILNRDRVIPEGIVSGDKIPTGINRLLDYEYN